MSRSNTVVRVILLLACVWVQRVSAQDIDLFMSTNLPNTANPNVLIVIDNASSNNSFLSNTCNAAGNKKMPTEMCVLSALINSPAVTARVNIGLALFTPGGATKGGFINSAVKPMDAAGKAEMVAKVNAISTANAAPYALTMHEAYLYFKGLRPYAGTSPPSPYDPAAILNGLYVSPFASNCQKNYIVYIGNGGPDSGESTTAQDLLTALGGKLPTDPIPLTPNNFQSVWMDEYARFLYKNDLNGNPDDGLQNIVTYTVGVYDTGDKTKPTAASLALLKSAATQGGGKYFAATDTNSLVKALTDILAEVQAVNSVFAAVTLPVSVNVRGTYLNQVYMGVFRPDEHAYPRWVGNLKEYQLQIDLATSQPYLADVNGAVVTNNATGFVSPSSLSYWSHDSTYWNFMPNGLGLNSDAPDGDIVEKGAEAQWLRTAFATSQAARKLYTCTGICLTSYDTPLSGTPFDATNTAITTASTGTASAADLADLLNWMRGQDIYDENGDTLLTDARASIHGDVLHSVPAVINYNRYNDSNDVFVYYGGNDGMFHAIQGGQIQPTGTPVARQGGTEQWSFVPSEFHNQLLRIRDNNVNILAPNPGKPYYVDGPIGVYQLDANGDGKLQVASGDKVYLYPAMRRGGRFFYALNVTDPTAPAYLWRRSNTDAGYSEMAQTWSMPKPVKIRASANPVLIMGAGYDDTAEDPDPRVAAPTKGRGVYVIDATNGNILWRAGTADGMNYSVAADVQALDRDRDGLVDRLYVADTGANVWRIDIDDASTANWKVTKLASLGGALGGVNDRKFLFSPDVVFGDGTTQTYDAVLIGSGDREHPFNTTVIDRYFMIKDVNIAKAPVPVSFVTITLAELYDTTSNLIQVGTAAQQADANTSLNSAKGWYITMRAGEKIVSGSVTMGGAVFFGTNQPAAATPGVCTNLGTARIYAVSAANGSAMVETDGSSGLTTADRSSTVPGGGFPPTPVPVITVINGTPTQAVISGSQLLNPPSRKLGTRIPTFWHNDRDR